MRKLIQEVKESRGDTYQLYAELNESYHPKGYHSFEFKSVWTGAQNPELEQTKSKIILTPEGLRNLKALLESVDVN